ncbi:MAG: NAD(P)H-hydrate dehydratase, partial [Chitinophagaceae bacterium]|nr:NAD(P)H-hydrate dehydratase [Chitinophagaceae bacterium]
YFPEDPLTIFCGKGNNGGDGLAIARLLSKRDVIVYILESAQKGSSDFQENLARLEKLSTVEIRFIQTEDTINKLDIDGLVIDALFGSGLNRPLDGIAAKLVERINQSGNLIVSIDLPSGMFADQSSLNHPQIKADHTLSFQAYKKAFLMAENAAYCGDVHILEIGLHYEYYDNTPSMEEQTDEDIIYNIFKPRNNFGHKGTYGHSLLIAGSYGKIGAAVLAAEACLRSGAGLVTCHLPSCGYAIMQTSLPEVMVSADVNNAINTTIETDLSIYRSIGIGPGLGTASETRALLKEVLTQYKLPVVLDADALNSIAKQPELLSLVPAGSILTPHPKEFQRLFGETSNEFERIDLASQKAKELDLVIILKGHHTLIAMPDGRRYFNSTGNAGMATGGSGDVLTGILTGLLAQGYKPANAAILGVYLHGMAGDLAAEELSMESMISGDITKFLGKAYRQVGQ